VTCCYLHGQARALLALADLAEVSLQGSSQVWLHPRLVVLVGAPEHDVLGEAVGACPLGVDPNRPHFTGERRP